MSESKSALFPLDVCFGRFLPLATHRKRPKGRQDYVYTVRVMPSKHLQRYYSFSETRYRHSLRIYLNKKSPLGPFCT